MLSLSLLHASTRGFNQKCIIDACTDLQLSSAAHTLLKPIDVIHFAMKQWNRATIDLNDGEKFKELKVSAKIRTLIQSRLQQQTMFLNHWNSAMAEGARPEHSLETGRILWQFADDSWYLSGDRSTDYNHYTKRMLFLYAYVTTELHLLTDRSKEYEQSWMFLDRRMEEILSMGSDIMFLRQVLSTISSSGYYAMTMFTQYPPK